MTAELPEIDSRAQRLLAYLRHNRDRMLADLLVILAWVIATSAIFDFLGLPTWLYYIVLFAGVVMFTRITPTWERPYRSPDLEE